MTGESETATCSTAPDAYAMMRQRRHLSQHPDLRRQAIADFVRSTMEAATDLHKFMALRRQGAKITPESEEAMQYVENMIRIRYRECFGTELGQ